MHRKVHGGCGRQRVNKRGDSKIKYRNKNPTNSSNVGNSVVKDLSALFFSHVSISKFPFFQRTQLSNVGNSVEEI